mmetsp:Transcript_37769/g.72358  ORF Transcript_37769/g.72358 Transcript_37769/m.72358 type:complete len:643 (+) Transcript_37769:869-2797(+)
MSRSESVARASWEADGAGLDGITRLTTSSLSALVTEAATRQAWAPGNSMVFMLRARDEPAVSTLTAHSYESSPELSPRLTITFESPGWCSSLAVPTASPSDTSPPLPRTDLAGLAFSSGYFSGCTVFLEQSRTDGSSDGGMSFEETSTTTHGDGRFLLEVEAGKDPGEAALMMLPEPEGCVDVFTGSRAVLPLSTTVRASVIGTSNELMLNPLTTLLAVYQGLLTSDAGNESSQSQLRRTLVGMQQVSVELEVFDAVRAVLQGSPQGEAVFVASNQLALTMRLGLGYMHGVLEQRMWSGNITAREYMDLLYLPLAQQIRLQAALEGGRLDLSDVATLETWLEAVEINLEGMLLLTTRRRMLQQIAADPSALRAVAVSAAEMNAIINKSRVDGVDGISKLLEVSRVLTAAEVVSKNAQTMVATDGNTSIYLAMHSGEGLTSMVAATEVPGASKIHDIWHSMFATLPPTAAPTVPPTPATKGTGSKNWNEDVDDFIEEEPLYFGLIIAGALLCCGCCIGGSIIVRRMGQNVIPQDTLGELSKPLPDDHKRQELAPEDDAEEEDETAPLKSSTTEAGAVANHLSNSKDLGRRASPSLLPQSQQGPLAKLDVKGAHKKDREDAERAEFENILKEQQEYIARRLGGV